MPVAKTAEKKLEDYEKLEDVIECVLEIAKALKKCAIEKPGFFHRDIKPQNIFFIPVNDA